MPLRPPKPSSVANKNKAAVGVVKDQTSSVYPRKSIPKHRHNRYLQRLDKSSIRYFSFEYQHGYLKWTQQGISRCKIEQQLCPGHSESFLFVDSADTVGRRTITLLIAKLVIAFSIARLTNYPILGLLLRHRTQEYNSNLFAIRLEE